MRRQPLALRLPRPSVVGVLNLTPDSFSDGGAYASPSEAAAAARALHAAGAALVDVGGESTRPGAQPVAAGDELERVLPVLAQLEDVPLSIDTSKAEVAAAALAAGVELVNDVTALRSDPALAGVVAGAGAYLCLMHMQGEPRTMQASPRYGDVVSEVAAFLEERLAFAVGQGVAEELICLDPGIGFGKTLEHNLELLGSLDRIVALGRPVLVGLSRKSFVSRTLGDSSGRVGSLAGSLGAAVAAFSRGAAIFRVHDVREHVEALRLAHAIEAGAPVGGVAAAGRA